MLVFSEFEMWFMILVIWCLVWVVWAAAGWDFCDLVFVGFWVCWYVVFWDFATLMFCLCLFVCGLDLGDFGVWIMVLVWRYGSVVVIGRWYLVVCSQWGLVWLLCFLLFWVCFVFVWLDSGLWFWLFVWCCLVVCILICMWFIVWNFVTCLLIYLGLIVLCA